MFVMHDSYKTTETQIMSETSNEDKLKNGVL